MPYNLYIDKTKDARNSSVLSTDNTSPNQINAFVLGDTIPLYVHILDGTSYAAEAGNGQIRVSIGQPGNEVYTYSDNFGVTGSIFTGSISLATQEAYDALAGGDYVKCYIEVEYTYPLTNERRTFCQEEVYLYNTVLSGSFSTTALPEYITLIEGDDRYVLKTEAPSASFWILDGNNLYAANDTWSFGLGTSTPDEKFHTTGNAKIDGNVIVGGYVTGSVIGNLTGTASRAISSSYAFTSSYARIALAANSAAFATFASSSAVSDLGLVSLYASAANSSSYSTVAQLAYTASLGLFANTASVSVSSSFATTASYFNQRWLNTGSRYPITSSWSITSSYTLGNVIGTSSWASNAVQSTYATTSLSASYASRSLSSSYVSGSVGVLNTLYLTDDISYITKGPTGLIIYSGGTSTLKGTNVRVESEFIPAAANIFYVDGGMYAANITASRLLGTASWSNNSIVSTTGFYASQSQWSVSSSYASRSLSSSFATTASYFNQLWLNTGSTYPITSSVAGTSSNARTASYSLTASALDRTAYAISVTYASQSQWTVSASFASSSISASFARTASYFNQLWLNTGSRYPITSSWAITSSNAVTASYFNQLWLATGSTYPITSSRAISSSFATTASYFNQLWLATGSTYPITASRAITSSYALVAKEVRNSASYLTLDPTNALLVCDGALTANIGGYASIGATADFDLASTAGNINLQALSGYVGATAGGYSFSDLGQDNSYYNVEMDGNTGSIAVYTSGDKSTVQVGSLGFDSSVFLFNTYGPIEITSTSTKITNARAPGSLQGTSSWAVSSSYGLVAKELVDGSNRIYANAGAYTVVGNFTVEPTDAFIVNLDNASSAATFNLNSGLSSAGINSLGNNNTIGLYNVGQSGTILIQNDGGADNSLLDIRNDAVGGVINITNTTGPVNITGTNVNVSTISATGSFNGNLNATIITVDGVEFNKSSAQVDLNNTDYYLFDVSTGSYNSAHIDYSIIGDLASRAGTMVGVWKNGAVRYNEVCTVDIGNCPIQLSMSLSGGNIQFIARSDTGVGFAVKSLNKFM